MPTLGEVKALFDNVAARFPKGATYRARLERERQEVAERDKPAPPPPLDPNIVILTNWVQRDEQAFAALLNVIDGFIQSAARERRLAVDSHARMALEEGRAGSLSELRKKLTDLRG